MSEPQETTIFTAPKFGIISGGQLGETAAHVHCLVAACLCILEIVCGGVEEIRLLEAPA